MIDRQEKLWLIRQQIARSMSETDHGDAHAANMAQDNALGAIVSLLDHVAATQEVLATKLSEQREVKELPSDMRKAVDDLRTMEATKIKRRSNIHD